MFPFVASSITDSLPISVVIHFPSDVLLIEEHSDCRLARAL